MKKITRASRAAEAATAWHHRYVRSGWVRNWEEIYQFLLCLGSNPSPDDVNRVIGNTTWTKIPTCSECGAIDAPFVIEVGETPDYESATVYLCPKCVAAAAELSGQEESK